METILNLIIGLGAAIIGAGSVILYNTHMTNREKKALVLVFAKEFMLLFKRCSMYYEQSLKGAISFSTLFQSTDSATLTKLAEVAPNVSVVETIVELKADFFQVIRWADWASMTDPVAQSKLIAFFMGGLHADDKSLDRKGYREKLAGIREVLDYLQKLNCDFDLGNWLGPYSNVRQQKEAITQFVTNSRKELDDLEVQLNKLRLKEKELRIADGDYFAPDPEESKADQKPKK